MANLVLEPLEGEAPALPDPLRHLLRLVDAVHLLPLELLQLGRVDTFWRNVFECRKNEKQYSS